LRKLFREARQLLVNRLSELNERDRLDWERAAEEAKVSVDKDGINRARCAREHPRQAQSGLNQLSKMVKERLERGDDRSEASTQDDPAQTPATDTQAATETAAPNPPESPSAKAEKGVYRSEPIVPQVPCWATTHSDEIGGSATAPGGSRAAARAPVRARPDGPPW
jgi:hypothetical protein